MKKSLNITLVKSLIGRKPQHIEIAKQLGLKKINATVTHQDNPCIRGMVNKINYLLTVEEAAK